MRITDTEITFNWLDRRPFSQGWFTKSALPRQVVPEAAANLAFELGINALQTEALSQQLAIDPYARMYGADHIAAQRAVGQQRVVEALLSVAFEKIIV